MFIFGRISHHEDKIYGNVVLNFIDFIEMRLLVGYLRLKRVRKYVANGSSENCVSKTQCPIVFCAQSFAV